MLNVKKYKKRLIIPFTTCVAAIFIYLLIWPISFNINREIIAQRMNMQNPHEIEYVNIEMRGRYSFNLLGYDTFRGIFYIEGHEYTRDEHANIRINRFPNVLAYFNQRMGMTHVLGDANVGFLFRSIEIIVYNRKDVDDIRSGYIDINSDNHDFIIYPTTSVENIINRYAILMDFFKRLAID